MKSISYNPLHSLLFDSEPITPYRLPEFRVGIKTRGKAIKETKITTSKEAAALCRECFEADSINWRESFIVIACNRRNQALGFYRVSVGGITGTDADLRIIYQFALLTNATAILIAHNHPSGTLAPSVGDEIVTMRIDEVGKMLNIGLLDHIIITADSYYSFADNGKLQ